MSALQAISDYFATDPRVFLEIEMIVRLVLQLALFVASAFFSGSETALFALSRLDLRLLRREHHPKAETIHYLLDQPRRLVIAILSGNELVNIAAAANMTGILVHLYDVERAAVISAVVMVPMLLLFGEATPKTISISYPRAVSERVAGPIRFWSALVSPLIWLVRLAADRLTTRIVGAETAPENILQLDEFRTLVEEGVVSGELSAAERALIFNLLQAGAAEIDDIMTPRTHMAFIDGSLPLAAAIDDFVKLRHTHVPVYRGVQDNVVGIIDAERVLQLVLAKNDLSKLSLEDVMDPPVIVPLTKKIDEMFDYFRTHDASAAVVLDEFGGVVGFLTQKDVLSYVFGRPKAHLAVNYDAETDAYEVPGDMKLVDLNKLISMPVEDPRMTTIGGVIFRYLDRLPQVGDVVPLGDMRFTVIEMTTHRIDRVRVSHARVSDGEVAAADDTETPAKEE